MAPRTIEWVNNKIGLIDQTQLPARLKYIYVSDLKNLWQAIKSLKVRGAPALGAAAGLGVYLGIKDSRAKDFGEFSKELDKAVGYLASCRPTARNLFWGLERMCSVAVRNKNKAIPVIKRLLFKEAQKTGSRRFKTSFLFNFLENKSNSC